MKGNWHGGVPYLTGRHLVYSMPPYLRFCRNANLLFINPGLLAYFIHRPRLLVIYLVWGTVLLRPPGAVRAGG